MLTNKIDEDVLGDVEEKVYIRDIYKRNKYF